jgi:hypothetical protein
VTGHGTNVIQGLAVSLESTAMPTIVIIAGIISTYSLAGVFGVAIATTAMLALAGGGANAGIVTPTGYTGVTQFNDFDSVMAGDGAHKTQAPRAALAATWATDTTTAPAAAIIAAFRAADAVSAGVSAPVNSVLPVITGDPIVGETLAASTGTWSNSPLSYAYQWRADGVAISGATAATYVLTETEIDADITVTVTATNEGGSASATSAAVGPVEAIPAPQPAWSNVKLLLDFEGSDASTTMTDESGTPKTFTAYGNAQIDTAQFNLGASALLCDGTGDVVRASADSADFRPGTGTFCQEFFVRFNALGTTVHLAGPRATQLGLTGWYVRKTSTHLYVTHYDGSTTTDYGTTWSPSTGVWYHVAVSRDGSNNLRVFVDGVMISKTTSVTKNFSTGSTSYYCVGGDQVNNRDYLNGWIDGVRLTIGEALYDSDDSFVPPTSYPRS